MCNDIFIFKYMYILHIYVNIYIYNIYYTILYLCVYIYIHKDFWVLSLKSSFCAEP